jgi:cytochrome c biogenesis protein CcmG, thiol:disulfide interchange protein DsbE
MTRRERNGLMLALICLLIWQFSALLTPSTQAQEKAQPTTTAEKNEKAPQFEYVDLKKNKHTRDTLVGKVVLIDCWATWCGPCKKSIPELAKLKEKYGDRITVLGLAYDNEQKEVEKFLKKNDVGKAINYPVVFGTPQPQYFGEISVLPTMYIVDKKGQLRAEHKGYTPADELVQIIEKLLAEN